MEIVNYILLEEGGRLISVTHILCATFMYLSYFLYSIIIHWKLYEHEHEAVISSYHNKYTMAVSWNT